MGWLWGSSEHGEKKNNKDPMQNLHPSLRDYLKKEAPLKYDRSNPAQSNPFPPAEVDQVTQVISSPEPAQPAPKAPPSLFKDGRYHYLWKTYQSQSEVENDMKSDQEKISEAVEAFKYRKAEIGRAALENCVMEQIAVNECLEHPAGARDLFTMCKTENKALHRCHTMQVKFLKALGYLSVLDRPPEVDEQIQMHADTLYHRMLEQEKAAEESKAEGKPAPKFAPLLEQKPNFTLNPATEAARRDVESGALQAADLKESVQKKLKQRLEALSPEQRELEERAIKAEIRAGEQLGGQLSGVWKKHAEEREQRREAGKETFQDVVSSWFGRR